MACCKAVDCATFPSFANAFANSTRRAKHVCASDSDAPMSRKRAALEVAQRYGDVAAIELIVPSSASGREFEVFAQTSKRGMVARQHRVHPVSDSAAKYTEFSSPSAIVLSSPETFDWSRAFVASRYFPARSYPPFSSGRRRARCIGQSTHRPAAGTLGPATMPPSSTVLQMKLQAGERDQKR